LHIDAAFQPRRPDTLRYQTESNACSTRLKARSAIRTPVRSSAACTRASAAPPPHGLSPRGLGTARSRAPFQSSLSSQRQGEGSSLRASSRVLRVALRRAADHESRCVRPTSASHFLCTSTRASRATGISSRLASRPWPADLHPRPGDRWTWRFTTPNPLR